MSSVLVHMPDDGWFKPGCNTEPDDKMLCVIIYAYGGRTPAICQYRKTDWLHTEGDYFLDVSERWQLESCDEEEAWEPGFVIPGIISLWKPLGLPLEENQRIVSNIETWFDEN